MKKSLKQGYIPSAGFIDKYSPDFYQIAARFYKPQYEFIDKGAQRMRCSRAEFIRYIVDLAMLRAEK